MKNYLIVADDFTGANDTGVQLTKRGMKVKVVFKYDGFSDSISCVLDTETRNIEAKAAYDKTKKMIENINFSNYNYVVKKVDSTLRGNIAEEIKAIDEKYKSDLIIFMPALPDLNRITVNAIHYLNNIKITDTEIAKDPLKPVLEDNLVNILKKTFINETIAHIDIEKIRSNKFSFDDAHIYTVDAELNLDMKTVIYEALKTEKRILWIGSAGIADNLMSIENKSKPSIGLVSSVSETTRNQIKFAEKNNIKLIKVPIYDVMINKNSDIYIKRCLENLKEGNDIIILSSASYERSELGKTVDICANEGIDRTGVNAIVQSVLGEIVETVLKSFNVSGIFITGGETAIGFFDRIQANGVEIIEEIATGIPMMKVTGGKFENLKVITKAGAFGREDSIYYGLKKLKEIKNI